MNDDEERRQATCQAQGVPALFAIAAGSVFSEHYVRVREHKSGGGKIDAMLAEVGAILVCVPLEPQWSIQVYIPFWAAARLAGGAWEPRPTG